MFHRFFVNGTQGDSHAPLSVFEFYVESMRFSLGLLTMCSNLKGAVTVHASYNIDIQHFQSRPSARLDACALPFSS